MSFIVLPLDLQIELANARSGPLFDDILHPHRRFSDRRGLLESVVDHYAVSLFEFVAVWYPAAAVDDLA